MDRNRDIIVLLLLFKSHFCSRILWPKDVPLRNLIEKSKALPLATCHLCFVLFCR